jgi:hypothetical protein
MVVVSISSAGGGRPEAGLLDREIRNRVLVESREDVVPPRNRLSPLYINIATTRYNYLLGPQHKTIPKETKRKRREKNVDKGGSMKTLMIHNRCARRRTPTTRLAL